MTLLDYKAVDMLKYMRYTLDCLDVSDTSCDVSLTLYNLELNMNTTIKYYAIGEDDIYIDVDNYKSSFFKHDDDNRWSGTVSSEDAIKHFKYIRDIAMSLHYYNVFTD